MIVVEYFFSKQYMDFHFSTMAVSVGIFSLAFVYRGDSAPLKMLLTYVGRELSMWIYLLHPFFAQLLSTVADHLGIGESVGFAVVRPVLVLLLAAWAGYGIRHAMAESERRSRRRATEG